jgi:UDP-3-O-[3-hydroxymyristoyl] glucosamine N-acyltransferase
VLVKEIAEMLGAAYDGDGAREITSAASLESAGPDQISFAGTRRASKDAHGSNAGCLIVPLDFEGRPAECLIRVKDPRGSFAKVVQRLHPAPELAPGIHPTAIVGRDCEISGGAHIDPYCVIGDRVTIGAGSRLHANVTVYSDVSIGARALIHAGAVLGADGFGFVFEKGRYEKFPQIGRVIIGDDVEIGANSAVDRAALGATIIGDGTKLDNMVHIAHNCRIGRHVVIAAQTGIAGGSVVEDYAVIGGQVGIGDGVTIKSGAIIGSGAGILTSKVLKGGGEVYWGTPARPLKEYLEGLANVTRIPSLRQHLAELIARVDALEKNLKSE